MIKRKFFNVVALLSIIVLAASLFAACDDGNTDPENGGGQEHTHAFEEEWSFDAKFHWHEAKCEHDVVSDYGEHTYVDGVCTVCGYESNDEPVEAVDFVLSEREDEDGVYYVVTEIKDDATDVTIPGEYEGLPVKAIGTAAAQDLTSLVSVVIEDGVERIEMNAFRGCTALTSVTLSSTINYIGMSAFDSCDSLRYVERNGALYLGSDENPYFALISAQDTEAETAVIGADTHVFAHGAYSTAYENLKVVEYGGTLEQWCDLDFSYYTSNPLYYARHLKIDGSDLTELAIPESVTVVKPNIFAGTDVSVVSFPSGVTEIGDRAFYDANNIRTVELPSGVRVIGASAFSGCDLLETVSVPSSLESLGSSAFSGCENLKYTENGIVKYIGNADQPLLIAMDITDLEATEAEIAEGCAFISGSTFNQSRADKVILPSTLRQTASNAFLYCSNLSYVEYRGSLDQWCRIDFGTNYGNPLMNGSELSINGETLSGDIVIGEGITSIPARTFADSDIVSVTLPDSVREIGYGAFSGADSLTRVDMGEGIEIIGSSAFNDCTGLESIALPSSLTQIGSSAFNGCTSLTSVEIPDSVTSVGGSAFSRCNSLVSVKLPSGLEEIESYLFSYCTALSSIAIPSGVTAIGPNAFQGCAAISSFELPKDLNEVGEYAFQGCTGSITWKVEGYGGIIGDFAFAGYAGTELDLSFFREYGEGAFSDCPNLVTFSFNAPYEDDYASVTSGDIGLFEGCVSLESVTGIPTVANRMFAGCVSLTEIELPENGNNTVATEMFEGCTSLQHIDIPDGYNYIQTRAFADCTSLDAIELPASIQDISGAPFDGISAVITWESGSTMSWINYGAFEGYLGDALVLPASVTEINEAAFSGCTADITWESGASIELIGRNAFKGWLGESIVLPESVKYFTTETHSGYDNFANCVNLKSIVIPEGVTEITSNMFAGCTSLESVTLPSSLKQIYSGAFNNCDSLVSLEIPEGVEILYLDAFNNCDKLTSLTVPGSVTELYGILSGCDSLAEIALPYIGYMYGIDGNYPLESYVSKDNDALRKVTISGGSLPYGAFLGWTSLEEIVLPESLTEIPSSAFYGCSSLTAIEIPAGVTKLGPDSFSGCAALSSLDIPDGVQTIEGDVFMGCTSLETIVIPDSVTSMDAGNYGTFNGVSAEIVWAGTPQIESFLRTFAGYEGETITIPSSVVTLDDRTFADTDVKIIWSEDCRVTTVRGAFRDYEGTEIVLPDSVTTLGDASYAGADELTSITTILPTRLSTLFEFNGLTGIPESLTTVNILGDTMIEGALYGCDRVTTVNFLGNVERIPNQAFVYCSSLSNVKLPETLTTIGEHAFGHCSSLPSIDLPDSVRVIEDIAFDSSGITSIDLDGVTEVRGAAFRGCDGLTEISFPSSLKAVGDEVIDGCNNIESVYWDVEYSDDSDLTFYNVTFDNLTIGENVKTFNDFTFRRNEVSSLTFNAVAFEGVTGNSSLDSLFGSSCVEITIGDKVTAITDGLFRSTGITSLVVPESVKSIGYGAFENCAALASVVLPLTIESIGSEAFYGCTSLLTVDVSASAQLGDNAFDPATAVNYV